MNPMEIYKFFEKILIYNFSDNLIRIKIEHKITYSHNPYYLYLIPTLFPS